MKSDSFLLQFWRFGWMQILCCIFPGSIFLILASSKVIPIPFIARYDVILILCLIVQWAMVHYGLETRDELKVICLFHLIGLCLELYKVHMGSWQYPEPALFKVGGVPLYSGFMYASVASYICQAWKRFDLKITRWPKPYWTWSVAVMIYLNFFAHHFIMDLRWWITAALGIIFFNSWVAFQVGSKVYKMPMILSYLLIGFFIWVAENISTFLGAWQYPNQALQWQWVHLGKISSWFLLVIISVIIVVNLKQVKYGEAQ